MSDQSTVEERLVEATRTHFAQVRFRLASMPEGEFVMGWLNALASRGLIVIDGEDGDD